MRIQKISGYRKKINNIDAKLLKLLEKRFKVCKKIGKFKKENGMIILNLKREKQIIKSKIKGSNLSNNFVKDLFQLIFKESKKLQK